MPLVKVSRRATLGRHRRSPRREFGPGQRFCVLETSFRSGRDLPWPDAEGRVLRRVREEAGSDRQNRDLDRRKRMAE
jgi:hypothetical protein